MPTTHAPKRMTKHDLKTDAFTTSIFAAREWVETNLRLALIVAAAVVVVGGGTWGFVTWRNAQAADAETLFGQGGVEMRSGNMVMAIAQMQKVLDEHPHADVAGMACFQLAQMHFRQRSFDDARVTYRRYIDDYGKDPMLVAAAWAGMGAVDEQAGSFAEASQKYDNAVAADPKGFHTPEYLRVIVRCAIAANDTTKALAALATLEKDFPKDVQNHNIARSSLIEHGFLDPGKS
ncbi:MAG: tetratricopeptide repeat protein [candidate division Zixibacteria bacterium]|nr:tetratricopeptide repeat protein [candidate division Zixibacteria bacterium]